MKRKTCILLAAAACLCAAAALIWADINGYFLPDWVEWHEKNLKDGNVQIDLKNRQVRVWADGGPVWTSGRGVRVQDVLLCDIDHDGEGELMLLCWRRGRYGKSRPFWVKRDPKVWSQHIFIYNLTDKKIRPVWMASDLSREVRSWSFSPETRLLLKDRKGQITGWDWQSFGLTWIPVTQLTVAALGDNLIHHQIAAYAYRHNGGRFDDLFEPLKEELSRCDICSINQEGVFGSWPQCECQFPMLTAPFEVGDAIINAGFDIVSCANNHSLDRGAEALERTVGFLRAAGICCPGINMTGDEKTRPYEILEKNGIRCAVFGYTQSLNGRFPPQNCPGLVRTLDDEARIRAELRTGRKDADLVLVYVHWGTEYETNPDTNQRRWAKIFADCGADAVIGTHPHVLQNVEWVEGTSGHRALVYYSLGNFISAQTDEACRCGGLASFTAVKADGRCVIEDYGLKRLITEEKNGRYTTRLVQP